MRPPVDFPDRPEKYPAPAVSGRLRREQHGLSVTVISPDVTRSELASTITDPGAQAAMAEFRRVAIEPDATARAIACAVGTPGDVDVSEITMRPTASAY